jgi:hypothetical protein
MIHVGCFARTFATARWNTMQRVAELTPPQAFSFAK